MLPRPVISPAVVAIVVLLAALAGSLLWGRWQAAEATRYEATALALEADLTALRGRLEASQRAAAAAQRRASTAESTIRGALNENPDWRDAPVPPAIRDRLCEYVSCAPVRATEVPRPSG